MSQLKLPRLRDYFYSNLYQSQTIKMLFTYTRWRAILSCLHIQFVNPRQTTQNKTRTREDPIWRIRWAIEFFNKIWMNVYRGNAFLSIDEAMIPTKIRHVLKQYIKGKPHKWGFKLYVTACPLTGICMRAILHDGSHKTMVDKVSACLPNEFQKKGRIIVMDNYYITVDVLKWLLEHKLHCIGTVQKQRIPFSIDWCLPSSAQRGTIRTTNIKLEEEIGMFLLFYPFSHYFYRISYCFMVR